MRAAASVSWALALSFIFTDSFGADLLGTVTRAGKPQAGQQVRLRPKHPDGTEKPIPPATTDASGTFLFEGIRPGKYVLDCNEKQRDVEVRPGARRADCKD